MGEITGISWCDHTFNPWIGCAKVSQGCKLCYAETQNKRYNWTGGGWGPGAPRRRTSAANWKKPLEWAKKAVSDGVTRRVFCASLADVFDPEAPDEWRTDLWALINQTKFIGGLEWLILTKRPEHINYHFPVVWLEEPPDCIRLGVTCEDMSSGNRRVSELHKVWRGKTFISVEPMLDSVRLYKDEIVNMYTDRGITLPKPVDWVICGGESGPGCRPMNLDWARALLKDCRVAGIPFFFKQIGGHPNKRHNPAEWPEDLRVQEFPPEEQYHATL